MEDYIQKYIDLFGEYRTHMENQIYINMFVNCLSSEADKEKALRVITTFNKHGVPTKVLCEVCTELVKEGVFE